MAFDQTLAERIRGRLASHKGFSEKRMFGGLAFLLDGNMCCGVHQREMIVRLDPQRMAAALAEPHTRAFDLSGRPMKGWILVNAVGVADDASLAQWLRLATDYAATLPAKK
ncbi:MAG TPA: TfoX/Sxy family protein [Burkholderiales bacterium]|jgi:TfoX/Sxy family transcriptional regulator of competence genes|nr:TfoX/Sxy family protein [Burkholderiales bacterium]